MLKIIVFDAGWGGQLVANYLSSELKTVEVVTKIDWEHAPYEGKSSSELASLIKAGLKPYVGQVDLIVLGGYVVSLLLADLEKAYPEQKFVGMGINFYRILHTRFLPEHVTIMCDEVLQASSVFEDLRRHLPDSTLIFPDCSGWENLINIGEMSTEVLRYELKDYFNLKQSPSRTAPSSSAHPIRANCATSRSARSKISQFIAQDMDSFRPEIIFSEAGHSRPNCSEPSPYPLPTDTILLLNTHYWEIRAEIEAIFGFSVRVMDFRQKLLHDVCLALKLHGVDGERSK